VLPKDSDIVTSTCNYGEEFASTINKDNIYAAQFHPEKSQSLGLKILECFIENA
jgi:glutamine amidotransferase